MMSKKKLDPVKILFKGLRLIPILLMVALVIFIIFKEDNLIIGETNDLYWDMEATAIIDIRVRQAEYLDKEVVIKGQIKRTDCPSGIIVECSLIPSELSSIKIIDELDRILSERYYDEVLLRGIVKKNPSGLGVYIELRDATTVKKFRSPEKGKEKK